MCIQSTYSQDNGGSVEEVAATRRLRQGRRLDLIVILIPLDEVLHAFLY